ncbi:MAG: class I SAM-dependent methyltransferase, partial [Planctomycetota bacterium]
MASDSTINPHEHNRYAWDKRVRDGQRFTRPLTPDDLADPKRGLDPWLDDRSAQGKRVLCLGAGGGRQGVQYAMCGADVVVVDISDEQLALDREAARSYRLPNLRTLQASMDELSELQPASFDVVTQPVSTCYVTDIERVYREVAR